MCSVSDGNAVGCARESGRGKEGEESGMKSGGEGRCTSSRFVLYYCLCVVCPSILLRNLGFVVQQAELQSPKGALSVPFVSSY